MNTEKVTDKVQVMLIDDSAVIRSFLRRIINAYDGLEVCVTAHNGQAGVDIYKKYKPDVVLMDIEMPVMDGITALEEILKLDADAKIIMCSTLSTKNADITLKAMSIGAVDYVAKPEAAVITNNREVFERELISKVVTIGTPKMKQRLKTQGGTTQTKPSPLETKTRPTQSQDVKVTLRETPSRGFSKPNAICIGSSTGGPQALFDVLKHLKDLSVPIFITQHMPATFTTLLATHITKNTGITCFEAEDGLDVKPGHAYLARGGKHMALEGSGLEVRIKLLDTPPENFCKPSVDPMFKSAVAIYKNRLLGLMLTGMGNDGLDGTRQLVEAGNQMIAQDKETSVVWGMPGAVAQKELCHQVLPLDKIGPEVKRIVAGS